MRGLSALRLGMIGAAIGAVILAGTAQAADPSRPARVAANVPAPQARSGGSGYDSNPLFVPNATFGHTGRYTPAPVPNQDVSAPPDRSSPHVSGGPTLFPVATQYKGDGYTYGSTSQGIDDKHNYAVPGVDVTYPLR